eukprot:scaffold825_cov249-Pinguiococcus_pyrenoidosus.AAC.72
MIYSTGSILHGNSLNSQAPHSRPERHPTGQFRPKASRRARTGETEQSGAQERPGAHFSPGRGPPTLFLVPTWNPVFRGKRRQLQQPADHEATAASLGDAAGLQPLLRAEGAAERRRDLPQGPAPAAARGDRRRAGGRAGLRGSRGAGRR